MKTKSFDPERALSFFGTLAENEKISFWCVLGHYLTVVQRDFLYRDALSGTALAQARKINEMFHHLTSCLNPEKRRSEQPWNDEELLRAMLQDATTIGLRAEFLSALESADRHAHALQHSEAGRAPLMLHE
jgi:hypothetical protein